MHRPTACWIASGAARGTRTRGVAAAGATWTLEDRTAALNPACIPARTGSTRGSRAGRRSTRWRSRPRRRSAVDRTRTGLRHNHTPHRRRNNGGHFRGLWRRNGSRGCHGRLAYYRFNRGWRGSCGGRSAYRRSGHHRRGSRRLCWRCHRWTRRHRAGRRRGGNRRTDCGSLGWCGYYGRTRDDGAGRRLGRDGRRRRRRSHYDRGRLARLGNNAAWRGRLGLG